MLGKLAKARSVLAISAVSCLVLAVFAFYTSFAFIAKENEADLLTPYQVQKPARFSFLGTNFRTIGLGEPWAHEFVLASVASAVTFFQAAFSFLTAVVFAIGILLVPRKTEIEGVRLKMLGLVLALSLALSAQWWFLPSAFASPVQTETPLVLLTQGILDFWVAYGHISTFIGVAGLLIAVHITLGLVRESIKTR